MANYDFSTLSSSDLEKLVCDLLNADLSPESPIRYKIFKDGKDKGIDFLYSSDGIQYNHVGQVKHYYRTGYSGMYNTLVKTEVSKVTKLKPERYIFATSVDLSLEQTEEIMRLFAPFITKNNDVYGKSNLNQLLQSHPDVLKSHFKLWFSDTAVLEKLLNAHLYYRSADFVDKELKRRLRLYVETPILNKAIDSLEQNNFVVIIGEPGVGKSTVAETIVYKYLQDDYKLLHIEDDIREAELFIVSDESKQIVYFDDFLGSNKTEINKAGGSERALLSIIRRMRMHVNKRLIFTTRVHILNTVLDDSEKLRNSKLVSGQTVFNLVEYDLDIKEKLLMNHIDEAEISEELKSILQEKEIVNFIINHQSFSPRSVEYVTTAENFKNFDASSYRKFIRENFDNPKEIWKHAYRKQIGRYEQILLNTLLTFDEGTHVKILKEAFNKRIIMEGPLPEIEINIFEATISRLNKGLINISNLRVDFHNTSLKDFLIYFLQNDPIELQKMVNAIRFANQFSDLFLSMLKFQNIIIGGNAKVTLLNTPEMFTRQNFRDYDLIRLAIYIQANVNDKQKNNTLIKLIHSIDDWHSLYNDYSLSKHFKEFLRNIVNNMELKDALKKSSEEIVNDMILSESNIFKAVSLLEEMAVTFNISFEEYDANKILDHFDELFSEHISDEVEWLIDFLDDEHEADEKQEEIMKLNERIQLLGIDYDVDLSEFKKDWNQIGFNNYIKKENEKDKR